MRTITFLILLLAMFVSNASFAASTDSLWSIYTDESASDSSRLSALDAVIWDVIYQNPDSAIALAAILRTKAAAMNHKELEGAAYNSKGAALEMKGDYPGAIDSYLEGLKIQEKIGDSIGMAFTYGNIGIICDNNKEYKQSLSYYSKGIALLAPFDHPFGMAAFHNNTGLVYANLSLPDSALIHYNQALIFHSKLEDKEGIADVLTNIGKVYKQKKQYILAIKNFHEAAALDKETGHTKGLANINSTIGALYNELGQTKKAISFCKQSKTLAKALGLVEEEKLACHCLFEAYERSGNQANAYKNFKQYILLKDSLTNEEKSREITERELNYEFEKTQLADSIAHESEKQLKDLTIQAQNAQITTDRLMKFTLFGGLTIIVFISLFIYKRLQTTKKQKKLIADQKLEVESAHDQLEEKNTEIIDSINYAKRIQSAMLQSEDYTSQHLPEHFIFFQPKDIVSGDFYWAKDTGKYLYFTAADCTGHGVPGAFMSMLGISFLNDIVSQDNFLPGEVLNRLRDRVISEVASGKGEDHSNLRDGMDISLVRYDLETKEIVWAGANNPLWVLKQSGDTFNALSEYVANRQPVGLYDNPKPFITHTVDCNPGDLLYFFSDGFVDQFGGPKGKKFKSRSFKELLLEIATLSLPDQKGRIRDAFLQWKGDFEQIDDVCVIGLRV